MIGSDLFDKGGVNSYIGEGTKFRGEFDLEGLLKIDGDFSGSIRTTGKVWIGSTGRVEGDIKATTVVIGGVLKGNVEVTGKVDVLSTGMVLGNIVTPRLIVAEGVIINGNCKVLNSADTGSSMYRDRSPVSSFTPGAGSPFIERHNNSLSVEEPPAGSENTRPFSIVK